MQVCHLQHVLWGGTEAGAINVACKIRVNYLIDEAVNNGKGANDIISMLHHFLATHNLGEAHLHLHADNCSG